jgi:hypothetical protein
MGCEPEICGGVWSFSTDAASLADNAASPSADAETGGSAGGCRGASPPGSGETDSSPEADVPEAFTMDSFSWLPAIIFRKRCPGWVFDKGSSSGR